MTVEYHKIYQLLTPVAFRIPDVMTSLVSAVVKNPSTMQEWVQSLGQKDHLENELAIHFSQYSFLGKPVTKDPVGL